MSLFTLIISEFIRGLHDSISGVPAVRKIDALEAANKEKLLASNTNIQYAGSQPPSILARRRAQQFIKDSSLKNDIIVISKKRDTIIERLMNCCILNGGLCCTVLFIFNYVVHPFITSLFIYLTGENKFPMWADTILLLLNSLYFMPLLIVSKIINLIWFQDIAEATYRKNRGRPKFLGSGEFIADIIFSFFHQSLFILQAKLVCYIISVYCPIDLLIDCILMLHMVPLYSLYAFEYRWFLMGWPVHKRITYIELHWAYFLGFGFFLGLLMYITSHSFFESSFLFALIFPLFIVSANEAKSMPQIIFPLPIFSPISRLADATFIKCIKHSNELFPLFISAFQFVSAIVLTFYYFIIKLVSAKKCFAEQNINILDNLMLSDSQNAKSSAQEYSNIGEDLFNDFDNELSRYLITGQSIVNKADFLDLKTIDDVFKSTSEPIECQLVFPKFSLKNKRHVKNKNLVEDYSSQKSSNDEVIITCDENLFVKTQKINSYIIFATTLTLLFLVLAILLAILEDDEDKKKDLKVEKGNINSESENDNVEIRSELFQQPIKYLQFFTTNKTDDSTLNFGNKNVDIIEYVKEIKECPIIINTNLDCSNLKNINLSESEFILNPINKILIKSISLDSLNTDSIWQLTDCNYVQIKNINDLFITSKDIELKNDKSNELILIDENISVNVFKNDCINLIGFAEFDIPLKRHEEAIKHNILDVIDSESPILYMVNTLNKTYYCKLDNNIKLTSIYLSVNITDYESQIFQNKLNIIKVLNRISSRVDIVPLKEILESYKINYLNNSQNHKEIISPIKVILNDSDSREVLDNNSGQLNKSLIYKLQNNDAKTNVYICDNLNEKKFISKKKKKKVPTATLR